MADISKCFGHGCPKRETCYRFTAPASEWQSYANFFMRDEVVHGNCSYYWDDTIGDPTDDSVSTTTPRNRFAKTARKQ